MAEADLFSTTDNYRKHDKVASFLLWGARKPKCKFSIMIPTYNRSLLLREAIKSAVSLGDSNSEIVIIDNSLTVDQEVLLWIKEQGIQNICYYHNEENIGMFGNWNRCFELAHGDWVLILNDDDTIDKKYLAQMSKIIDKYPEAAMIGCYQNTINADGEQAKGNPFKAIIRNIKVKVLSNTLVQITLHDFFVSNLLSASGALFNRRKALQIGGFNEELYPYSDAVFVMNMINNFKNCFLLQNKLFNYRIAVNESMHTDTLLAFVQGNYYMNKQIQAKEHFVCESIESAYRDCMLLSYEKGLLSTFGIENRKELQQEFESINTELNVKKRSKISVMLYRGYVKLHVIFLTIIKKKAISELQ